MGVLDTLNNIMDEQSIKESDAQFEEERKAIEASLVGMQSSVADEIIKIMAEKHLGVNEMRKLLDVSPTTFNKLKKGTGNPTIEIISLLSKISGRRAKIVWG